MLTLMPGSGAESSSPQVPAAPEANPSMACSESGAVACTVSGNSPRNRAYMPLGASSMRPVVRTGSSNRVIPATRSTGPMRYTSMSA